MTRQQRIEAVAIVIFRHRGCPGLLRGDHLSRDTVQPDDMLEAERFIDMLDAQSSSDRE